MADEPIRLPDLGDGGQPSASGILQCLRMLAEEAAALKLDDTLVALHAAIAACVAESDPGAVSIAAPASALLH